MDLRVLRLLLGPENTAQIEFLMEVTDKTRADVKVSRYFTIFTNIGNECKKINFYSMFKGWHTNSV